MTGYLSNGLQTSRLNSFDTENPLDWIADYTPNVVERLPKDITSAEVDRIKSKLQANSSYELSYTEEDYEYLARIDRIKPKQSYALFGYIEPNENGTIKRNKESFIRTSLIAIDYDDIALTYNEFTHHVSERLSGVELVIYPTIKHTNKHTRARVLIRPSRPLLDYEFSVVFDEVVGKIGLKVDQASKTWSQLFGLPVTTPRNGHSALFRQEGEAYKVSDRIEPPKPKKPYNFPVNEGPEKKVSYDEAIEIMKGYVEWDRDNLDDRTHALGAMMVLVKSYQDEVIDINTAYECAELLACGVPAWEHGNREWLRYEIANTQPRTPYSFKQKFLGLRQEATTIKDLKDKLRFLGNEWREQNKKVNEKTGEVKYPRISPRAIANILKDHCHFVLIGEQDPELSPLAVYDPDNGIYRKGQRFMKQLILSVEDRAPQNTCDTVLHFLSIECPEVEVTDNKNLIVFNNGIFDKKEKELLPFNKKYVFTNKVSTNYNPDAQEPHFADWNFSQWINQLADGDEDKESLFWQIMGASLDGNNTPPVAIFLYSEKGQTGKSTFQSLLTNLVGKENMTSLRISEFEHDFKLSNIYGKSLIIGDDNDPKSYQKSSANFKTVVSGDNVVLNAKQEKPFTYYSKALVIQSMNGIPRFSDATDGLLRRIRVVKFNHAYRGDTLNKNVKDRYIKDTRLLEYIAYKTTLIDCSNFVETKESTEEVKGIGIDNNPILQFYEEVITEMKSERLPTRLLFETFQRWTKYELNTPTKYSRNTFSKELKPILEERGYEYSPKNLTPFKGWSDGEDNLFMSWQDMNNNNLFDIDRDLHKYQPLFISPNANKDDED